MNMHLVLDEIEIKTLKLSVFLSSLIWYLHSYLVVTCLYHQNAKQVSISVFFYEQSKITVKAIELLDI